MVAKIEQILPVFAGEIKKVVRTGKEMVVKKDSQNDGLGCTLKGFKIFMQFWRSGHFSLFRIQGE